MSLFDFFTKLIKTVVKLIFPKKYHRIENGNQEKPTKTRVGDVITIGTPTVSISPAVPSVNTVRRSIQKPEPQPLEPGVSKDSVIEGRVPLPTGSFDCEPADMQEPALVSLELEVGLAEGLEDPGQLSTVIELSDPQAIEASIEDEEVLVTFNAEPEMLDIVTDEEVVLQPTELGESEIINAEGLEKPLIAPQINDEKEPSSLIGEQEIGVILEGEESEPQNTEPVVMESIDVEVPKLVSVEKEMVKTTNAEESKSDVDDPAIIEIDKDETTDVQDYLEEEEVIYEGDIDGYEEEVDGEVEVEDQDTGAINAASTIRHGVNKNRKKTTIKSYHSPFKEQVAPLDFSAADTPDVGTFLTSLESDTLDEIFNLNINILEKNFYEALKRYEFIGDLPVSEKGFERLID
jgi:hypothetical protein